MTAARRAADRVAITARYRARVDAQGERTKVDIGPRLVAYAAPAPDHVETLADVPAVPPQQAPSRRLGVKRAKALPPAELVELALACDRVLGLPDLAVHWRIRQRAAALRELLDVVPHYPVLYGPDAEAVEPVDDQPSAAALQLLPASVQRQEQPVADTVGQSSVVKGIKSDRVRKLAARAIEQGFVVERTAGGHVSMGKGQTRIIASTHTDGYGHGWANVRQAAKRAGIDVAGL